MRVEIDQSGRIEFTGTDTVLAYSDDKQYAILIPSIVKREIVRKYRKTVKAKIFFLKLFSVCLFLLIKNDLNKLDEIVIDIEFEGREKDIKNMLLNHIRKIDPKFPKHKILFRRITKESRAHKLALSVFRDAVKENKVITTKEIEELL